MPPTARAAHLSPWGRLVAACGVLVGAVALALLIWSIASSHERQVSCVEARLHADSVGHDVARRASDRSGGEQEPQAADQSEAGKCQDRTLIASSAPRPDDLPRVIESKRRAIDFIKKSCPGTKS